MAKLARALRTDSLADVDLRQLAQMLRKKGRGRDTVLAHITPQEAKLLKARGGRGSINPKTGLPEFEDDFYDFGGGDYGGDYGGGGGVVYEYYDPAPDAQGVYEQPFATEQVPGGQQPAAQDPNVQLLSATQTPAPVDPSLLDAQGNPILPPDPNEAGAAIAREAFDARNAETARIAGLADTDPERMRYEADIATRASQEPDFLSRLSSSLGLGNLGLGNLTSGLGAAGLLRLLTAGGAGAAAVRAGGQAQAQANTAADQIRYVADNQNKAGLTAEELYKIIADLQRNNANVAATNIAAAGNAAVTQGGTVQTGLSNIGAGTAARAADIQGQYNALASPYQTQGRELAQMGLTGGLTPAMAQAFQAAEARLAQQGINRGGVAAAQSANQLEALRAQLLGDEYTQGLTTQQIGDRLATQGIGAFQTESARADAINANALLTGLGQFNVGNALGVDATKTGLAGNAAANSLNAAGFEASLRASGISNGFYIDAIKTQLAGGTAANNAMLAFWNSLGSFMGGGTGTANAATTTARST
jgi:hypothetical protein